MKILFYDPSCITSHCCMNKQPTQAEMEAWKNKHKYTEFRGSAVVNITRRKSY